MGLQWYKSTIPSFHSGSYMVSFIGLFFGSNRWLRDRTSTGASAFHASQKCNLGIIAWGHVDSEEGLLTRWRASCWPAGARSRRASCIHTHKGRVNGHASAHGADVGACGARVPKYLKKKLYDHALGIMLREAQEKHINISLLVIIIQKRRVSHVLPYRRTAGSESGLADDRVLCCAKTHALANGKQNCWVKNVFISVEDRVREKNALRVRAVRTKRFLESETKPHGVWAPLHSFGKP